MEFSLNISRNIYGLLLGGWRVLLGGVCCWVGGVCCWVAWEMPERCADADYPESMRIYIPAVLADMARDEITERRVHGVTRGVREQYPSEDTEGLEMLATLYAADDSLLMLRECACKYGREYCASEGASEGDRAREHKNLVARRIVAVGEVPDAWVTAASPARESAIEASAVTEEEGAGAVMVNLVPPTALTVQCAIPWELIESIHVDEPDSEPLVLRACNGDNDAFEATGELELLWYDITEREALLAELSLAK